MTKAYEFNWQRPVPKDLLAGNHFDIWEEVSASLGLRTTQSQHRVCLDSQEKGEIVYEHNAFVNVDEFGFFIYWKSDKRVRVEGCGVLIEGLLLMLIATTRRDRPWNCRR